MSRLASSFSSGGSLRNRAAYAFRTAWGTIVHAPFTHVISACSIAVALFLGAVIGTTLLQARALLASWGSTVELTVYLDQAATAADGQRLEERIAQLVEGAARYVSPEQALERLASAMGEEGGGLRELERNPLPPSVEVASGRADLDLDQIRETILGWEGVEEVDLGSEEARRLVRVARGAEAAGLVLLPILILGAAVLAGSVVRLGVHERRREIEILRLVGATDAFVRAPFLVEGALAGLAGGLLAAAGLLLLETRLAPDLRAALPSLFQPDLGLLAGPLQLIAVVGAGLVLGLAATALSVERQLR